MNKRIDKGREIRRVTTETPLSRFRESKHFSKPELPSQTKKLIKKNCLSTQMPNGKYHLSKKRNLRLKTTSLSEQIEHMLDDTELSVALDNSKIDSSEKNEKIQKNNIPKSKKSKFVKGISQENKQGNLNGKISKAFKSLNNRSKIHKNISVWNNKVNKTGKLTVNVSRLISKIKHPSHLGIYSRRAPAENSFLRKIQKQIQSSKHGDELSKYQPFRMLNFIGKKGKPKSRVTKKHKRKPNSMTQIHSGALGKRIAAKQNYLIEKHRTIGLTKKLQGSSKPRPVLNDWTSKLRPDKLANKRIKQNKKVGSFSNRDLQGLRSLHTKQRSLMSISQRIDPKKMLRQRDSSKKDRKEKRKIIKRQDHDRLKKGPSVLAERSYFDSLLHNDQLINLSTNFLSKKSNRIRRKI